MIRQCPTELLTAALAGSLPPDDEDSLQSHLEECEACAAAMELMAGGPAWCQEAAAMLNGEPLGDTMRPQDEWSEVDFTVEHLEPTDEPNMLGRLGGYDVLEIIGRGGMGVVLKAFDRELKRCVAIKVLAPHLAHNSLAKKRFAREAQAAAAVVHPHVLAIHQVQPNGRLPFLVMPLVAGESLAQRLKTQGTLELKEILRIGMQAAAGLGAAHDQGLVHRDVKPANILLEIGVERAVLTDFGLARAADDVSMTRWGIIAGTPEYMSPEQAKGEPLDGRSDLFSLGCVLHEMATGISPFRTESVMATMRRLVDVSPQAMASLNPELPPWFIAIVEKLLEKEPSRRFGSAKEVSDLLECCLAHLQQPTSVPLPASLPKPSPRSNSARRKSRLIEVIAMLAILGIGSLAWIMLLSGDSAREKKDEGRGTGDIELVALAKYPTKGSPWWKPDGTPLSESPVDANDLDITSIRDPKVVWLTALFRVPGGLDTLLGGDSIQRVDGGMSVWGGRQFIRGQLAADLAALAVAVPSDAKHVDLAVRVARGAWQTSATVDAANLLAKGELTQDGKEWHVKREGRDLILKVDDAPKDVQLRLAMHCKQQFTIAVPVYAQSGKAGADSIGTARIEAWQFKDVGAEGIHSFILQTRPYEKIVFRNVALQGDAKPPANGAPPKAIFGPVFEREMAEPTAFIPMNPKMQYLDLDEGDLVTTSPPGDVANAVGDAKDSRIGLNLVTVEVPEQRWEATVDEVLSTLLDKKPEARSTLQYGRSAPTTYFFKTQKGSVGVLQLRGDAKTPGAVKIRFKLVPPDSIGPDDRLGNYRDVENLKGEWEVVSVKGESTFRWQETRVGDRIHIANVSLEVRSHQGTQDYYVVSPLNRPKAFDVSFWVDNLRLSQRGIYDLDGDRLTLCVAPYKGVRPTRLVAEPEKSALIVLKRIVPAKTLLMGASTSTTVPELTADSANGLSMSCAPIRPFFEVGDPVYLRCTLTNTTREIKPVAWNSNTGSHFILSKGRTGPATEGLMPRARPEFREPLMVRTGVPPTQQILALPPGKTVTFILDCGPAASALIFTGRVAYVPAMPSGAADPVPPMGHVFSNVLTYEVLAPRIGAKVATASVGPKQFIGRVVAVSKDAKSFTFEGTANDRPTKLVKFEVKIGEKTAITYDAVATGGAKPTVGYVVGLSMDDTVKGLATRVGFGGSEGGGPDVNGLVVDLDKDGKGVTLLSPLGGVVDGGPKPKNVNIRFNEKTVLVFSSVREGEARIEKNQNVHVWYDDDARVRGERIAGEVRFSGDASVLTNRPSDITGKLLSIDDKTLTIEQLAQARGEKPKKVILKIGAKSSIVYDNVRPGEAKPTAGQGVSVWLKDGSKDTATDIALSGDAPERWVMTNGIVVGLSDDRAAITLEQPSAVPGEKPKRVEIKLTGQTRIAYGNVGPDGARLTVGYRAWVRLIDGSKDTAAQVTFEGQVRLR